MQFQLMLAHPDVVAVSADARAAIDGFAAGALPVMLIDSIIPNAREDASLVTVLGFAVAAGLSPVSAKSSEAS
jgi:ZIP family zinc transporter